MKLQAPKRTAPSISDILWEQCYWIACENNPKADDESLLEIAESLYRLRVHRLLAHAEGGV